MGQIYSRILRSLKLPSKEEMKTALTYFTRKEKNIFLCLFVILIITTIVTLNKINNMYVVNTPIRGGSISEGIVGAPRFINPLLALSDADKDMTALIYSGLMRKSPDGTIIPDLANSYEISKDGISYTFVLKDNIFFQDNTRVTVDDVLFTIEKIKDPTIKSPNKNNWDGISVEKIDDKTIRFNLSKPYASFLENTTLGIMPEHIWKDSPLELNTANIEPVGSGPYKVSSVKKASSGLIEYYKLESFKKFALGNPYIKKITLRFYSNEEELVNALKSGEVEQISSITPENAEILRESDYEVRSSVLPRVFGIFFNPSQAQIFTDKQIIRAIDKAIDKDKIIREVLKGYGVAIGDPIPPNILSYQKLYQENNVSNEDNLKKAKEILAKDGYSLNEEGFLQKTTTSKKDKKTTKTTSTIEFTISTGNAPELVETAKLIQEDLLAIGIKVDIKTFEIGNLNQTVIRPRKYDALLFGEIINHESDLFAFWHSSQRHDPGLNVAMYANLKVDKILEDALVTLDENTRIKKYAEFEKEISNDSPSVFLYSPEFTYIVSKKLNGLYIEHSISPSDRFSNVYNWSVESDKTWKIFSKK